MSPIKGSPSFKSLNSVGKRDDHSYCHQSTPVNSNHDCFNAGTARKSLGQELSDQDSGFGQEKNNKGLDHDECVETVLIKQCPKCKRCFLSSMT